MKYWLATILVALMLNIEAQTYDYLWHLGNGGPGPIINAGMIINFFDDTLSVQTVYRPTHFRQVNASMCDTSGTVLFYSNGIHIANALGEIMENGDSLNPGHFGDMWHEEGRGYILDQGAIPLPFPGNEDQYVLFHKDRDFNDEMNDMISQHFYVSEVNMQANGGLGRVEVKNFPLLDEDLALGKLTATRHANGRDWWIPIRRHGSNEYHWFLFNDSGVHNQGVQIIGDSIPSAGIGQAVFSPDGNKYAIYNLVGTASDEHYVAIYDVDRCTGQFSNPILFTLQDGASCGGAAISSNSRFLYILSCVYAYQYDLWAEDIEASKDTVAIWDGFNDPVSTTFYLAQLAPNGEIYVNSNNGSRFLHAIENPDIQGDSCNFVQRAVELPSWNNFSMPNFPNYRLGHLEGSPCDTLRQPPVAAFSTDSNGLEWTFFDESYHDIRSWYWTFGDGQNDTISSPVHTYEEDGVYQVCLTVTNPRGEDTYCEQISVIVDGIQGVNTNRAIKVYPNPTQDVLFVDVGDDSLKNGSITLFDVTGRPILQHSLGQRLTLPLDHLPSGVYSYEVLENGVRIKQGKVVKL